MSVFGLTFILNRVRKTKIPYKDQLVMSLSGLRGGIAFSLTKLVPHHLLPHIHQMLTTCIAIILFTSFVQGQSAPLTLSAQYHTTFSIHINFGDRAIISR